MYEVVFFFQITAYVKIKLSPQQCKSGITSLVGGEVVGEVVGEDCGGSLMGSLLGGV